MPRRAPAGAAARRAGGARAADRVAVEEDQARRLSAAASSRDSPASFSRRLLDWQALHGRSGLPWQGQRDPYRVWLSEIMLQQTQVATVLGYYERFLARFPDVAALAAAPLDDVLALWSGLGYYSRARNLHRCAQAVMTQHGGAFPREAAGLQTLPGIGASTAAAIAAFCFDERVAILDGNVKRVLARWLAFDDDLAGSAAQRVLWQHATGLLPPTAADMPAYTQGLMDLGATLCAARRPQCNACPVQVDCRARLSGRESELPVKSRRLKRSRREHWWLWLQAGDQVWLQQREAHGVWAGLWTLPLLDSPATAEAWEQQAAAIRGAITEALPTIVHVLTHLDWHLHPVVVRLPHVPEASTMAALQPGRWMGLDEALALGLPAPLRRWMEWMAQRER